MVNIFYLDHNPSKCSKYYYDSHVNKIIIEIAQLLYCIHYEQDKIDGVERELGYKRTKVIKPKSYPYLWIKETRENYLYTYNLGINLIKEYKYRYGKNYHACEKHYKYLKNIPKFIKEIDLTDFVMTKNTIVYHKHFNLIEANRLAYVDYKLNYKYKYTKRIEPKWINKLKKKSINIKLDSLKIIKEKFDEKKLETILNKTFNMKYKLFIKTYPKMFRNIFDKIKSKVRIDIIDILKSLGSGHLLEIKNHFIKL
jgi:hypothetical protein